MASSSVIFKLSLVILGCVTTQTFGNYSVPKSTKGVLVCPVGTDAITAVHGGTGGNMGVLEGELRLLVAAACQRLKTASRQTSSSFNGWQSFPSSSSSSADQRLLTVAEADGTADDAVASSTGEYISRRSVADPIGDGLDSDVNKSLQANAAETSDNRLTSLQSQAKLKRGRCTMDLFCIIPVRSERRRTNQQQQQQQQSA